MYVAGTGALPVPPGYHLVEAQVRMCRDCHHRYVWQKLQNYVISNPIYGWIIYRGVQGEILIDGIGLEHNEIVLGLQYTPYIYVHVTLRSCLKMLPTCYNPLAHILSSYAEGVQ